MLHLLRATASRRRRRSADHAQRSVRSCGDARGPAHRCSKRRPTPPACRFARRHSLAVFECRVRAAHGRGGEQASFATASPMWRLAICFSRTCAVIGRTGSPAPASRRSSRCGRASRPPSSPQRHDRWRMRAYLTCVDPRKLDRLVRRPRVRPPLARRPAAGRRPVRRERRVPLVRLGWADVLDGRIAVRCGRGGDSAMGSSSRSGLRIRPDYAEGLSADYADYADLLGSWSALGRRRAAER